jgi:hypothetical protein
MGRRRTRTAYAMQCVWVCVGACVAHSHSRGCLGAALGTHQCQRWLATEPSAPPPAPQDIVCIGAGFRGQRAKKGFGDSKPPVMQASQLRTCGWLGQGGWGTPQDRPVLFRDTLLVCLTLPHEPRAFWITWSRSGELFTS